MTRATISMFAVKELNSIMKFGIFTLVFFLSFYTQASHLLGGEISWTCLPGGQYKFKLVILRECTGVGQTSQSEYISSNSGLGINCVKTAVNYINRECNAPICDSVGTSYSGAIEEHVYESAPLSTTSIPPPTGWFFSWTNCCRAPVANVNNIASGQFFTLKSFMYPYSPGGTSSTFSGSCYTNSNVFLEAPNMTYCAGKPSKVISAWQSSNGDSLYFDWAEPSVFNNPPNSYVNWESGYSYFSPLPDASFNSNNIAASINHQTGEISFLSFTTGTFTTCTKVSSYRNGQLISEVLREFPIVVKNCEGLVRCNSVLPSSSKVKISWSNPSDSLILLSGGPNATQDIFLRIKIAEHRDTVAFRLKAMDSDSLPNCKLENIVIRALGNYASDSSSNYASDSICIAGYPCATMKSLNSNGLFSDTLENTIDFKWYVSCDLVHKTAVDFVFKISNNTCPFPTIKLAKVTIPLHFVQEVDNPVFDTAKSGFNKNGEIELFWNTPDTANSFYEYQLYKKDDHSPFTLLASIPNYLDTHYVHLNPAPGITKYWIRSVGGCLRKVDSNSEILADSISPIVFRNVIGIEERLRQIAFYPQPFNVKVVFEGFENESVLNVQIFDIAGRLLKEENAEAVDGKITIQTNQLKQGVYVFVLSWADYSTAIKLIKHE